VAQLLLSLLPVLLFLILLKVIDTYKLVTMQTVWRTLAGGCGAALVCYAINTGIFTLSGIRPNMWARTGAPILEEAAKAACLYWLIRKHRVGFMVDAAISGFALGAGFAIVENVSNLPALLHAGLLTCAVRGLGTAFMHGGTTGIFGIISINRVEIKGKSGAVEFLPGLAIATAIHLFYNQPWVSPPVAAGFILLTLPGTLSLIFWRSEKALETWMGTKLDKDLDLLQMITTGTISDSRAGSYLRSLEQTFAPLILADMICYLQLSLELSAQAKGDLLRREIGFPTVDDPELPGRLKELKFLEGRIGGAGKLALGPLLGSTHRDTWEIQQLKSLPG
jgi:RsiW-degrading membrane proteinase PrsW (M82 family)